LGTLADSVKQGKVSRVQKLERYFGIRIDLVDQIDPQKITILAAEARLVLASLELNPDECHLYFHELRVVPVRHHFSHSLSVAQRVDGLLLSFRRNPKQTFKDLRFLNRYMNRGAPDVFGIERWEDDDELRYVISGDYIDQNHRFQTDLVTFVRVDLRQDHRKIKASVKVSPTQSYDAILRTKVPVLTKLDLRYSRLTQLNRPPIRKDREHLYSRWFDEYSGYVPHETAVVGPSFKWRGPSDSITLQSLFDAAPVEIEIGDIDRACQRAKSVCRVEDLNGTHLGTGVLITPDLMLTNFHVVFDPTSSPRDIDGQLQFRFGSVTQDDGTISAGRVIAGTKVSALVSSSPTKKLDYALIRLSCSNLGLVGVPLDSRLPRKSSAVHIIQHPGHSSGSMKLVMSGNAVTSIMDEAGKFQYVTKTSSGSSGAPCFNAAWKMIGLHRAEDSSGFFVRREGILIGAIAAQIGEYLT
jgi:endonuclease G, mitochondrial